MEFTPKAVPSNPCEPCSGTPLDGRNLNPEESEERARARAYYEKVRPRHPTDPFGLQRMERVKTDVGLERLCNQLMREVGLGEPTRREQRRIRAEIRNKEPKLSATQIDRNAFRHPGVRERCPRLTRGRRPAGWKSIHFVLPLQVILGLGVLTRSLADRQHAERKDQPHGFQRRYPKTKNHWVVAGINHVLREHGLEQFCAELPED